MKKSIGIIGCGWLGLPLAIHLLKEGYNVLGSTTTESKLNELQNLGVQPFLIDFSKEKVSGNNSSIFTADYLVINFPPIRNRNVITDYPRQVSKLIKQSTNKNTKVIFIGSTSVYPSNNDWVTEEDAFNPDKPSGKAILLAEGILKSHFKNNLTILRPGGLFGEKRDFRNFLKKRITDENADIPINLVHQKDCIEVIKQILVRDIFGEIFNLVCDTKITRRETFHLTSQKPLSIAPNSYKLVRNEKIKEVLDYSFLINNPLLA